MNLVSTKPASLMNCLLVSQNDGRIPYGPTEPPLAHHAMASSLDSLNGNVASSEPPKRPKILSVASNISFAAKALREDSADIEDGSLPCTPEMQSDSEANVSNCSAGDEALESDTRQLLLRFFTDYTELSKPSRNESKALSTIKRVVEDALTKHRYVFNGMINRLSLENREEMTFVREVATSLFADRITNWGRIASLLAFGAVVCQNLKESGRTNTVELVGQEISTYLLSEQRDWLLKNNSWDGFVDFFQVPDPESNVRNTLMAFAGFAGIGATLALLIR